MPTDILGDPLHFSRSANDSEMSSVGLSVVLMVPRLWVPSPCGPFMDLMILLNPLQLRLFCGSVNL